LWGLITFSINLLKQNKMNANVKGMLWTAGAVVVGIIVAKLIQDKLLPTSSSSAE